MLKSLIQKIKLIRGQEIAIIGLLLLITYLNSILKLLVSKSRFKETTPVVVIYKGTWAEQVVISGTIETIYDKIVEHGIKTPAITVIGPVAALTKDFQWVQSLPLFGLRVVLLRAMAQVQDLQTVLGLLGADVILQPMINCRYSEIEANKVDSELIRLFNMIIFSSVNGVHSFMKALLSSGLDSRSLNQKIIIAVGPKTADTLKTYGILADYIPSRYSGEGIIDYFSKIEVTNQHVLVVTSDISKPRIIDYFEQRGIRYTRLNLYQTQLVKDVYSQIQSDDIVLFTSESTVTSFFDRYPDYTSIKAVAIGETTYNILKTYSLKHISLAKESTLEAIVQCLLDL
ncbi:hypothetical protein DID75_05555 [Candidatus Marinamargulisbacteria bacterium SCGC AG-410-N11]|nr:hypothetical protein DID75_05555 [Candidatus Marinamargulisbacteria bacterium SCGC AG-410-N11]